MAPVSSMTAALTAEVPISIPKYMINCPARGGGRGEHGHLGKRSNRARSSVVKILCLQPTVVLSLYAIAWHLTSNGWPRYFQPWRNLTDGAMFEWDESATSD